jgi:hypothetical protein
VGEDELLLPGGGECDGGFSVRALTVEGHDLAGAEGWVGHGHARVELVWFDLAVVAGLLTGQCGGGCEGC